MIKFNPVLFIKFQSAKFILDEKRRDAMLHINLQYERGYREIFEQYANGLLETLMEENEVKIKIDTSVCPYCHEGLTMELSENGGVCPDCEQVINSTYHAPYASNKIE